MVVDLKQVGGKYDEFRTGDTLVRAAYDDGYWSLTVGFPDINWKCQEMCSRETPKI